MAALINHVRGVALAAPWVAWLFIVDFIVSALLPLKLIVPDAVYDMSSRLAGSVWIWVQYIFTAANGAHITMSGDAPPRGESAIVVANHVGWTDFYMIQAVAVEAGMLGRCRYFAKVQLRWVPFLGWGLWAMGMPLVSRRWDKDRKELDRVFGGIVQRGWPTWLVSYSEATRFTPRKYAESLAFCEANGRPQPQHLLYPRTKGFVTTVQHLRKAPHVKAVYDLAIAYQHGDRFREAPTMWESLSAAGLSSGPGGYRFHVHVRRFLVSELPATDAELATWLEQRWVEKGEWLEAKRAEWSVSNKSG